jgi:cell division protein FtsB
MSPSRRTPNPRPGARSSRAGTAPARGGRATGPGTTATRAATARRPHDLAARRRKHSLTSRAAVLALVVCGLMLTLAYPVREFVEQRTRIADLREEATAKERSVAELERRLDRWKDPAYVKAQARERLHFAMPGETQYVVLEPDEIAAAPGRPTPAPTPTGERPWYSELWGSIESAAEPE